MMVALWFWMAVAGCTPVHGPTVQAGDLAIADPRFAIVPANVSVGYGPAPGSRRLFSEAEMDRLGKRFGVEGKSRELCFEYAMHKLDKATILAAIEQVIPGAEVELLDTVNFNVPEGPLVFSRAILPKPPQSRPDDPVIWRGYIEYAEGRKFAAWAKIRIAIAGQRVIALKDVAAGQEITVADVELRSGRFFPDTEHWARTAEGVVGQKAVLALKAGSAVRVPAIQPAAQLVSRGDLVTVEVEVGAAHLRIESRAESGAAMGDLIKLRNAKSGKIFEARVTGKSAAMVRAPESDTKGEQ